MQKAAVLERFGEPYTLKRIPQPANPQGQDVLIKVLAASYCHTDAVFASGAMSQTLPLIGCHEFAGEIVSLGAEVSRDLGLAVGSRVGVPGRPYHPCTTCYECTHASEDKLGYSTYCSRAGNLGLTMDGGFQEYCIADSRQVALLPDRMTATQAAPLMCAGFTIWTALHHEKLRHARKIAILGAGGGLGHLGVQFAIHRGLQVLAIDANDKPLELLKRLADRLGSKSDNLHIADAREHDLDFMRSLIGETCTSSSPPSEFGVDAAIFLPESQAAFDLGMKLLKHHGTIVVVSFPDEALRVSAKDLVFRDISLVGTLLGRTHQLREMLTFAQRHGVVADVKTFSLEQINTLVDQYNKGFGGKLVVDMTL